jgi:hypothetical protein
MYGVDFFLIPEWLIKDPLRCPAFGFLPGRHGAPQLRNVIGSAQHRE